VPLVTGPGYASSVAFSWLGNGEVFSNGNAVATFDATGRLTEVSFSDGQFYKMNGTHAEFGTDGILAWGRWTGNVSGLANIDGLLTVDETYDANQGLHYVVGMPTPVMPTVGTATYSLMGATLPTYVSGSQAPGVVTGGALVVGFSPGSTTVSLQNFSLQMPDRNYMLNGSTSTSTSLFTIFPSVAINGTPCSSCSSLANGFFAGASAERAGLSYHIQGGGEQVVGAAAFKK